MFTKMGAKSSKKPVVHLLTKSKLTNSDIKFIKNYTGYEKEKIITLFDRFIEFDDRGKLKQESILKLYCELRPEFTGKIDILSPLIFSTFDYDDNGYKDLRFFMVILILPN